MARPTSIHHATVFAEVAINIGSVGDQETLKVTTTVKGLRVGRPVFLWTEAALDAGLVLSNAHASDSDELTFTVGNVTTGDINPAEMNFSVVQF